MHESLKENFIADLISAKKTVYVELRHGIRFKGILVGADKMCVFLEDAQGIQVILKQAIGKIIIANTATSGLLTKEV